MEETHGRKPRAQNLAEVRNRLLSGAFGKPGERFVTTEELAEKCGVAMQTAHNIMQSLEEERLIRKIGKRRFLTYGLIGRDSPLFLLTGPRQKTIGMHVTYLNTQIFARRIQVASQTAAARGYQLLIASSDYDMQRERAILHSFEEMNVAGVLTCPGIGPRSADMYNRYPLPHVFLGMRPEGTRGEAVLADNYEVSADVASYFLDSGFRHFGYCGIKMANDKRLQGFSHGLLRGGVPVSGRDVLLLDARAGGHISEEASEEIAAFLSRMGPRSAIYCYNEQITYMFIEQCEKLQYAIPGDILLVGFDDVPAYTRYLSRPTTVSCDESAMTENAVNLLIAQIETGEAQDRSIFIKPKLVIRG